MIDMTSWEELTANVMDDLHLDPHNVRLDGVTNSPEPDIMADLFRNEKALNLVEGIAKVGYLTHELPIVVRRNRKLIVVEGNRRLAALKAIQNPYLVPDYQSRISAFADEIPDRSLLRIIQVKRAPNQDAADQLIAALHTGESRVSWSPSRQAAFFQAQIDQGKTLKQLKQRYPTIDVEKYVLRSGILSLFRSVQYQDPELTDYMNARKFPTSTLSRIYDSKQFIDLSGMELSPEGDVTIDIPTDAFVQIAEVIISGMKEGDINTRSVGKVTTPRFVSLMDELKQIVDAATSARQPGSAPASPGSNSSPAGGQSNSAGPPNPSNSGGFPSSGGTNPESPAAGSPKPPQPLTSPPKLPAKPNRNQFLDTSQLSVPANYPEAVKLSLGELSQINVRKFPNATFDLMRTMLEKSIKARADVKGVDLRVATSAKGYVFLSHCVDWLEQEVNANGPKYLKQVITQLRSTKYGGSYLVSMDHLNAINHNHRIFVTADQVQEAWKTMVSLLAEALKP